VTNRIGGCCGTSDSIGGTAPAIGDSTAARAG
jgi:hypothetical protein